MIWLMLLAQAVAAAPALPTEWAAMPAAKFLKAQDTSADLTTFVAQEVAAGRCVRAKDPDGVVRITVRVALLASADGQVRRLVPEAIDCPTVEQFSVGVIEKRAPREPSPVFGQRHLVQDGGDVRMARRARLIRSVLTRRRQAVSRSRS